MDFNSSEDPNPVADEVHELSIGIFQQIESQIGLIAGDACFDHAGPCGMRHVPGDGCRRSTNDECSEWNINVFFFTTVDTRKPIPIVIAEWLRKTSATMLEVAETVEAIEETRDLRRIRAVVSGFSHR